MIEVKPLPYEPNALAPHVSEDTINTHYGKHYKGYINNLNKLVKGTVYEDMSLEDIVQQSSGPIFNNAAQAWNHEFYFNGLTDKETEPSSMLKKSIFRKWGTIDSFKQDFNSVAKKLFGSGWTWLVWDTYEKSLSVFSLQNADNPLTAKMYIFRDDEKYIPLMVCDMWEHAYYIDQKNDKDAYLKAFWNVVNWDVVNKLYEKI